MVDNLKDLVRIDDKGNPLRIGFYYLGLTPYFIEKIDDDEMTVTTFNSVERWTPEDIRKERLGKFAPIPIEHIKSLLERKKESMNELECHVDFYEHGLRLLNYI